MKKICFKGNERIQFDGLKHEFDVMNMKAYMLPKYTLIN